MMSRDGECRLEQQAIIRDEGGLGSLWPSGSQYIAPTITSNGRLSDMWFQPQCQTIRSSRFDIHFHLSQVGETPIATNISISAKDLKGKEFARYSLDGNLGTFLKITLGKILAARSRGEAVASDNESALPTQNEQKVLHLLKEIAHSVSNAARSRTSPDDAKFNVKVFNPALSVVGSLGKSALDSKKDSSPQSSNDRKALIFRNPPDFEILSRRPSLIDERFEIHFNTSGKVNVVQCSLYPEQRAVVVEVDETRLELIQALSQAGLPRLLKVDSFPNETVNQTLWRVTECLVSGGFRSLVQHCAQHAVERISPRRAEKGDQAFNPERFKANLSAVDQDILQGNAFRNSEISETTPSGSEVAIALGDEVISLAIKATESEGSATRSWTLWAPQDNSIMRRKELVKYLEEQYAVLVDPSSSGYKLRSTVMSLNKHQLFHRDTTANTIVPTSRAADGLEMIVGFETGMYLSSLHSIDIQPIAPELAAVDSALEILSGMQNLSINLIPEEVVSMRADIFNHASVGISPFGMNITLRNGLGGQMNLFLPAAENSTIDEDFRKFANNFSLQPTHGRLHVQLLLEQWAAERPGATCTCLAELPEELDLPPKFRNSRSYTLRPNTRSDADIARRRSLHMSTDGEGSRGRGEFDRFRGERPNRMGQRLDYIFLGRVAEIAGQVLGSPETLDHGFLAKRMGMDYSFEMGSDVLSLGLNIKNERVTSLSISIIKEDDNHSQFRILATSDTSEQGLSDLSDIRKIFEAFTSLEDELEDFHFEASEQEFFQHLTEATVSKCLQELFGSRNVNTHKVSVGNQNS